MQHVVAAAKASLDQIREVEASVVEEKALPAPNANAAGAEAALLALKESNDSDDTAFAAE